MRRRRTLDTRTFRDTAAPAAPAPAPAIARPTVANDEQTLKGLAQQCPASSSTADGGTGTIVEAMPSEIEEVGRVNGAGARTAEEG